LTTKIHALVDGCGLPVRLYLSEGQASDCRESEELIDAVPSGGTSLAYKAYDSDAIHSRITE
jgi:transposase